MADTSRLVLCDVLCFLSNKFVNTTVKVLKSTLVDFYDVEDVVAAKQSLLVDIADIETSVKFPHTPHRRDSADRITREVDDILAIFTCLDENKLLDKLPKYVASGPDSMPSVRLYESDLNGIMVMLSKLHVKMGEYGEAIAMLSGQVKALQTRGPPVVSSLTMAPISLQPLQPSDPLCESRLASSVDFPTLAQAQSADSVTEQPSSKSDWASIAVSSTPIAHTNRFAALQSADDEEQSDGSHGGPFTTTVSRRSKRTRNRVSPLQSAPKTTSTPAQPQQVPTVFGRSSITGNNNIVAAKKLRKKLVLCVDNLSMTCTVSDIVTFVTKRIGVEVLTCFETKSRRRRGETTVDNRKAFRLCICEDDRDRVLDAAAWPDSIVVAQWFFKTQRADDKRPRLDNRPDPAADIQSSVSQPSVIIYDSTASNDLVSTQVLRENCSMDVNDETVIEVEIQCANNGED